MKRMILLLLVAQGAFAQHEYIVPLTGSANGIDADHAAVTSILNPAARTAALRVTGVYPVFAGSACDVAFPAQLAPRGKGGISVPSGCLAAVSIESTEPLAIETKIHSHLRRTDCAIFDVQAIRAGTEWIPFAAEALTYGEFDETVGLRANLLLINPNAFHLRVRIELHRPEANGASRVDTIVVEPQSTILHPLAAVPLPGSSSRIVSGHHDVILSADGRFWAGVSSLTANGGNHFAEAVALEP